jgi:hypothetical protein
MDVTMKRTFPSDAYEWGDCRREKEPEEIRGELWRGR